MNNRPRILILEDVATDAELIEGQLREANVRFDSLHVETKDKFLKALAEFAPDIVLSNFCMSQFSGLDALRLLKESNSAAPFIFVAGSWADESAIECMKEGADDYIPKTSLKRLPAAVLNALEKGTTRRTSDDAIASLRKRERKQDEEALRAAHDELEERVAQRTAELAAANELLKEEIAERLRAEKATRRSEQFAQGILDSSPDCTKVLDLEGNLLYISPSGQQLMEITNFGSCINSSWSDFWEGAARQEALDALAKAKAGGIGSFEGHRPTASGTPKWWSVIVSPIRDANGQVERLLCVSKDITASRQAQEALRVARLQLEAILEAGEIAIWDYDILSNRIAVNKRLAQLFSVSLDEAAAGALESYTRAIHADDRRRVEEAIAEAVKSGNNYEVEHRVVQPNGSVSWIIARGQVERDAAGAAIRMSGVIIDTTERKQIEQKLQQSEDWLRAIFDASRDGILVEDNGRIVYVNNAYARMLGYDAPEELVGTCIAAIVSPDDAERMTKYGEARLRGETPPSVYEFKAKRKGGSLLCVEGAVSTSVVAGKIYITTAIRDITGRKRAEEALRESEQRYRFLGESILHQVWTAQPNGKLDYVNKRTLEYFGFTVKQALVEGWLNVVHPDDKLKSAERWMRSLQTGEYYEMEFRLKRADGEYRWHLGRATAGRGREGQIVKWFGTNTDINDQKLAEEALRRSEEQLRQAQKLEAVGRLAGGIAHDFNNLLTAINGYSELTLRRLAPDDSLHHNVTEIKKAGERAAALTRQLLAFSRKQILQPKVLDLNNIVTDIGKILQRVIGEDVNILTVLDPNLSRIEADAGQLEQIVMNLAVNARDAMPGGGKLTIKTANVELSEADARQHTDVPPGSFVMLAVSDTGTGMDAATQAQIFEPFFTTKAAGKGTGLGLATVYGIVKQSGGNICVHSQVGHGTAFEIYLPCAHKAAGLIEKVGTLTALPRGTETILLVEDEDAVRELLREVLEADGYSVLLASGGEEALQLCSNYKKEIHLMLTDVVMPGMNGRELGERAAALWPEMKVLYMSGYTDEAIIRHGALDASVAFLEKPFTPDSVARKVREVLNKPQKIYKGSSAPAGSLE